MRLRTGWLALFALLLLPCGCAFVNVDILRPAQPLREQVLEGEGRPKILLLDVTGFISEREKSGGRLLQGRPSMVAQVKEALQKAEKERDIAGVIVRINSPGGTVAASDIIRHEILGFRERKKVPVHAWIMGIGTSGGYYVATAADEIAASPTAVTGSIGVLTMRFNVEGLLSKVGVSERTFRSGDKKDLMSPFRASTPEEERIVQGVIDSLHGRFVDAVQAGRKGLLERKEVELLADGRIYTADQALAARLIDRVGYLDEAVEAMKKSLGIERARVVAYYRPGSYRGTVYSGDDPVTFNLININADLEGWAETGFLYLWRP